jgi:hypothetical protein
MMYRRGKIKLTVTPDRLAFAKTLYVFGMETDEGKRIFPSLRKVSKKAKIPFQLISKLSYEEDWEQQRGTMYNEYYRRVQEDTLRKLVENSSRFRESLFGGAALSASLIIARLKDIQERAKEKGARGLSKIIRGYEMRDLAMAMEGFKRIGMESIGDHATEAFSWKDLTIAAKGRSFGDRSLRGQPKQVVRAKKKEAEMDDDSAVRLH